MHKPVHVVLLQNVKMQCHCGYTVDVLELMVSKLEDKKLFCIEA